MHNRFSILVCGGQDYYGPTGDRDREVVKLAAQELYCLAPHVQVITGGTGGIPDDFAQEYTRQGGQVIDIVSSEHLGKYQERTSQRQRPYLVLGDTQEKRRFAFLLISNSDLRAALSIQGGKYTTHELELLSNHVPRLVSFIGSGGASGGQIPYDDGYIYKPSDAELAEPYASTDPKGNALVIAQSLIHKLLS